MSAAASIRTARDHFPKMESSRHLRRGRYLCSEHSLRRFVSKVGSTNNRAGFIFSFTSEVLMLFVHAVSTRKSQVFILGVILFSSLCVGQNVRTLGPATTGNTSLTDELTNLIEVQSQKLKLPGVTVAVVRDRSVIYKGAFGFSDLATKAPRSLEQPQPIGSITKVFAATMLMQLAERGVVRLDDLVVNYVPEYKVHSPFPNTQPTN